MLSEIVLVNASKLYPDASTWEPIVNALQTQLTRDVGPALGVIPPPLRLVYPGASVSDNAAVVTIVDDPDVSGALGYHDETTNGRVYGRVFVKPTLDNGGSLSVGANSVSVTLSHEIIELEDNPFVQMWADNFLNGYQHSRERCDAVESDDGYAIDGVSVSNFVLDRWFDSEATAGPFDFLENLTAPFTMTTGGYFIRRAPGGKEQQVYGKDYPAWKAVLKYCHGRHAKK